MVYTNYFGEGLDMTQQLTALDEIQASIESLDLHGNVGSNVYLRGTASIGFMYSAAR